MVSRLKARTASWLVALLFASPFAAADETSDAPARTFHSALLDNFFGDWQVTHKFGSGRTAENTLHVEWVLNHQFLELHYRDVATPPKLMRQKNKGKWFVFAEDKFTRDEAKP
jgi:hypothetical protein